ncbi:MAG TPA: ATP-binding protein [Mucilaginibacter sp.]|jgi:two-component system CheB/CheR fusion protein|nr:ATP-binding protein [Mucilaginibacter sp.]
MYDDKYTVGPEGELKQLREKLASICTQQNSPVGCANAVNEGIVSMGMSIHNAESGCGRPAQKKNRGLRKVDDDLTNYLRSNIHVQLFIDDNLRLTRFSQGAVQQINLQESDIGRPLGDISANIKFETITDDIKSMLQSGIVITNEVETTNGKWYQVTAMPYLLSDNSPAGAVITFNDITELKITQLELDKKNTVLSNLNADLDNFVHTVSHDLLAPLANIEGSIDVMNHIYVIDPAQSKFLAIINSSVKKFRALINDISVMGKLEGESILQMVDIDEQIDNVEWSLENQIKSSGAVIIRDLEVKAIPFSRNNLRSILYNLISNGLKFKDGDPPEIHIHTRLDGDNTVLSVSDNGIGMSPDSVDKIFNLYGRLDHSIEGHGIGLYLVRKIVVAAGGTIRVDSEPGKGSTFTIKLSRDSQFQKLL